MANESPDIESPADQPAKMVEEVGKSCFGVLLLFVTITSIFVVTALLII